MISTNEPIPCSIDLFEWILLNPISDLTHSIFWLINLLPNIAELATRCLIMTRWMVKVYGYGKYFTESITWQLTGKLYPFSSDKKAIIAPIFSRLYHSIACFSAKLKAPVCTKSGATCRWGPASSPECRCELCHSDDTNWGTQVGAHFLSGEKFAGKRQLLPQTFQLDHLTPRVSRDYCICHVTSGTRDITMITVSGDSWYQARTRITVIWTLLVIIHKA